MKSSSDYEVATTYSDMYESLQDERWKTPSLFATDRSPKPADDPESEKLMDQDEDSRPAHHRPTRILLQIIIFVLVLLLALQMYILWQWKYDEDRGFPWTSPTRVHATKFVDDQNFQNMHHDYDTYWASLLPPSMGLTQLPGDDEASGIAMFHQLHCLHSFRRTIQDLQDGKQVGYASGHEFGDHQGHWPHCFDYMRQVLLCHADDTRVRRDSNGQFSGLDFTRNCRDHEILYKQAEEYALKNPPVATEEHSHGDLEHHHADSKVFEDGNVVVS